MSKNSAISPTGGLTPHISNATIQSPLPSLPSHLQTPNSIQYAGIGMAQPRSSQNPVNVNQGGVDQLKGSQKDKLKIKELETIIKN